MRAAASFSFTGRHSASTAEIGVPSAAHGPSPQSLRCRIVRNRAALENHHHRSPNASSSATTLEQQPAFGANHVGLGVAEKGSMKRWNKPTDMQAERPPSSFFLHMLPYCSRTLHIHHSSLACDSHAQPNKHHLLPIGKCVCPAHAALLFG